MITPIRFPYKKTPKFINNFNKYFKEIPNKQDFAVNPVKLQKQLKCGLCLP